MSLAQIETHPDLIDQVHDRLLAAVVDGTLEPGRRLTQGELAAMLGVSRQPVSHAIQVLRRRGLLVDCGRGIAAAPLDASRIRHLYQVRAALDGLAAELAAGRCATGEATRAEKAELRAALDAGCQELAAARTRSPALLIEADVAFHSALHRLSGNGAIVETVAEQWPHFRRSMRVVLAVADAAARVWAEHRRIHDAVVRGDARGAGELARGHAVIAAERTVERLAASGSSAAASPGPAAPSNAARRPRRMPSAAA